MGGTTPAKQYILEALEAGKQVVTANKDLLAEYGEEVMGMARQSLSILAINGSFLVERLSLVKLLNRRWLDQLIPEIRTYLDSGVQQFCILFRFRQNFIDFGKIA